jgi:Holliday junction resolvasome RuvABC endonuclease subunit
MNRWPICQRVPTFLEMKMTEDQIKHMVNRFLNWRLPESFSPDCGISFKRTFNEHTAHPMKYEPMGTNLLNYEQAEAMVRHMLEGISEKPSQ